MTSAAWDGWMQCESMISYKPKQGGVPWGGGGGVAGGGGWSRQLRPGDPFSAQQESPYTRRTAQR